MGADAAVGVDDDLAAGEAGVAVGAADDEASGRIDVVFDLGVQELGRDDLLDDLLDDALKLLALHRVRMLVGDDDRLETDRLAVLVEDGDLAL
jgi:hypothetical protein